MIGSHPSDWEASNNLKRRALTVGAVVVLVAAVASVAPVIVLAATYAIYDAVDQAACQTARKC